MRDSKPIALGELAALTMGQSPQSDSINADDRGLPFLQGCAEFGVVSPEAKVHCSPVLRFAHAGATLISVRAPVGTMNRADQDYAIGRGLAAVLAKVDVADNTFLRHAIEHGLAYLHRRSQGSTFLAISSDDLRLMPIPAFGYPSQRRIAEILSTLDEAIEQTEALIAKTQAIKAGLMHDLFTRGVTANGELRPPREEAPQLYKASPLGWIPKEWRVEPLDQVGTIVTGRTPPATAQNAWGDYLPFVTPAEIGGDGVLAPPNRRVSLQGMQFVNALPAEAILVVCIGSTLGKIALAQEPCVTNQQINTVICRPATVPAFVRESIHRHIYQLHRWAGLQAVPIVKKSQFSAMCISMAPIDEQMAIAHRLLSADLKLSIEAEKVEKLKAQKTGLMHDLLTGRVAVPLPVP